MQPDANVETTGRQRDELFEALTDRHRRRVLDVLRTAGQPLTLTALAEELALRTEGEASEDRTERLRVSLYHRHVPKLADTGLVEFDADRKTVALAGSVPEPVAAETERTLEIQQTAGVECSNCSAVGDGDPRTLGIEADRRLEVALCGPCYRAFVAAEWVDAAT